MGSREEKIYAVHRGLTKGLKQISMRPQQYRYSVMVSLSIEENLNETMIVHYSTRIDYDRIMIDLQMSY